MAKTKMTGFARLLIFLIFILPLAFFGAAYINGEDPIQKFKNFTGMGNGESTAENYRPATNGSTENNGRQSPDMEKRILQLERDLAISEEKLARCKLEQAQ